MRKSFIILLFLFIAANTNAQDDDSLYYEDDFIKDTTSIWHIGFSVGSFTQAMLYSQNNNNDSISLNSGKPNTGVTFGLLVERDFSEKLWFKSGININIAKMNINYKYKSTLYDYNYNSPNIEIPIWLQFAFKTKQRGWSWGAGIKPSLDISHSVDFNNRLFEIRKATFLLGTGPTRRWQLSSGRWVNLSLAFDIGLLNVFKDVNNIYNNAISEGRPWHIQMILSLD